MVNIDHVKFSAKTIICSYVDDNSLYAQILYNKSYSQYLNIISHIPFLRYLKTVIVVNQSIFQLIVFGGKYRKVSTTTGNKEVTSSESVKSLGMKI